VSKDVNGGGMGGPAKREKLKLLSCHFKKSPKKKGGTHPGKRERGEGDFFSKEGTGQQRIG